MLNLAHKLFGVRGLLAAIGLVAFGIGMGASIAQAQPSVTATAGAVIVAESGRIGPIYGHTLHIGRSTANDVRRAEGRKPTTNMGVMGRAGIAGRVLTYRIGKGKSSCKREYGFSSGNPRLSSFESTCRDTQTATGTRFGMSPRQVQGHQFAFGEYSPALGHDCNVQGSAVATEYGNIWLVVWMKGVIGTGKLDTPNMVQSIAIYGDNAVFFAAACA
ncbi:MAG: hypothetical protein ABSB96_07295 [Gaiellaceae bacterium]